MMTSKTTDFISLHQQASPLLLANVWDAASTVLVQKLGAKAIATSSASLCWANGYADGAEFPISQLLTAVSNILRVSSLPVTVDIEGGYSDCPKEVATLVEKLAALGVAGINIEDGVSSSELLREKIIAIRQRVDHDALFINARCDVYLRELVNADNARDATFARLIKYEEAGASGFFVPGLSNAKTIKHLCDNVSLPLNLMVDNETDIQVLKQLGVKRLSHGPNTFLQAYDALQKNVSTWFGLGERKDSAALGFAQMNSLF